MVSPGWWHDYWLQPDSAGLTQTRPATEATGPLEQPTPWRSQSRSRARPWPHSDIRLHPAYQHRQLSQLMRHHILLKLKYIIQFWKSKRFVFIQCRLNVATFTLRSQKIFPPKMLGCGIISTHLFISLFIVNSKITWHKSVMVYHHLRYVQIEGGLGQLNWQKVWIWIWAPLPRSQICSKYVFTRIFNELLISLFNQS